MNLAKYTESANLFLRDVAKELGHPSDSEQAWRVLRTVLHVLRRRLTFEESFDLMAQLPMLVKALYIEGWNPRVNSERIKNIEEFLDAMVMIHGSAVEYDMPTRAMAYHAAKAVFHVLQKHVSLGEIQNIESVLPENLKEFWYDEAKS